MSRLHMLASVIVVTALSSALSAQRPAEDAATFAAYLSTGHQEIGRAHV